MNYNRFFIYNNMDYQDLMECVLNNCGLHIIGIDKIRRRMIPSPEFRAYIKNKPHTGTIDYIRLNWREFLLKEDIEQVERIIKFHILYWINTGQSVYSDLDEYIQFIERMWKNSNTGDSGWEKSII